MVHLSLPSITPEHTDVFTDLSWFLLSCEVFGVFTLATKRQDGRAAFQFRFGWLTGVHSEDERQSLDYAMSRT